MKSPQNRTKKTEKRKSSIKQSKNPFSFHVKWANRLPSKIYENRPTPGYVIIKEQNKNSTMPLEWDDVEYIKSFLNFSEQPWKLEDGGAIEMVMAVRYDQ